MPTVQSASKPLRTISWANPGLFLVGAAYIGGYALGMQQLDEAGRLWLSLLGRLLPLVTATLGAAFLLPRISGVQYRQAWIRFNAVGLLWIGALLIQAGSMLSQQTTALQVGEDLSLLVGYLAMVIGLRWILPLPGRSYGRLRLTIDLIISGLALTSLAGLLLGPLVMEGIPMTASQVIWTLAVPYANIFLLVTFSNILLLVEPGPIRRTLLVMMLGVGFILASEALDAYWMLRGTSILTTANSTGWTAGYTIFACVAIFQIVAGRHRIPIRTPGPDFTRLIQQVLPFAATLVLIWYAILDWQFNRQEGLLVPGIATLCLLGLILRQGVAAGERELQEYILLVDSVAEPSFICDNQGFLKLANPALERIYGRSEGWLAGRPLTDIFPQANWQQGTAKGGWSGEVLLVARDGKEIPVYLSLRPVRGTTTRKPDLAGTAHDLRVHQQQQKAIQDAYEEAAIARFQLQELNADLEDKVAEKTSSLTEAYSRLEEQNRALQSLDTLKSDFVSLVSHELRAPLTNIAGGIELVLSSPEALLPDVQETLSLVQKEILRLSYFVQNILDLSTLDAGRVPVYPVPISIIELVNRLSGRWMGLSGIENIDYNLAERLPLILADDRALTSVFIHLIDNAQKYAPGCQIIISAWQHDGFCFVSVEDDGPGFPPEAAAGLFEKFTRLQNADAQAVYGHGLGLYMVRKLLQAMQGDVTAENRPGGGARFIFWLPAAQGDL